MVILLINKLRVIKNRMILKIIEVLEFLEFPRVSSSFFCRVQSSSCSLILHVIHYMSKYVILYITYWMKQIVIKYIIYQISRISRISQTICLYKVHSIPLKNTPLLIYAIPMYYYKFIIIHISFWISSNLNYFIPPLSAFYYRTTISPIQVLVHLHTDSWKKEKCFKWKKEKNRHTQT